MDRTTEDRVRGALVAMAAGDALGAGYEPPGCSPSAEQPVGMIGGGYGDFEPGEWTDDTSMAIVILQAAQMGELLEPAQLDRIAAEWFEWAQGAPDVGAQTSKVLRDAATGGGGLPTWEGLAAAARELHVATGRTAGNGSLMRTAPVALAYLDDRSALAEAARLLSGGTHHDDEAGDACVLWCAAIANAIATGEVDIRHGLPLLPSDRQDLWARRIKVAEQGRPSDFTRNGWVVEAFQGAWSAIATTCGPDHLSEGIEAAVRGGGDTDTVAAIAGSLLGAAYGESSVPGEWRTVSHGWPSMTGQDLSDGAARLMA